MVVEALGLKIVKSPYVVVSLLLSATDALIGPLSSKLGTYTTIRTRIWSWLSGTIETLIFSIETFHFD